MGLFLTNDSHGLVYSGYATQETAGVVTTLFDFGWWYAFHFSYIYLLIGIGMVVLVRVVLEFDSLASEEVLSILGGSIAPLVASLVWVSGNLPTEGLRIVPFTIPIVGLAYGNALFRYRLLSALPAVRRIGRNRSFDEIPDGIVLLDDEESVVDLNDVVEQQFGCSREAVVGEPLSAVVGDHDVDADAGVVTTELQTATGIRPFEIRIAPIQNDDGTTIGYSLVLREVTGRRLREQRLEVLNRVLRHNLRNDLTVVRGYVEMLADDEDEEMAKLVDDTIADLVELGEKAQRVEEVIAGEKRPSESVDLQELLGRIPEAIDVPDGADLDVEAPEGLSVTTDRETLWLVVTNLVENALEHGGEAPAVTVTTTRVAGGGVEISVADDGPGIPEAERAAIESGSETALEHGSGLGLWLVSWGTDVLGADLSFEVDGGTTVTVGLPVVDGQVRAGAPGTSPNARERTASEGD